MNLPAIEDLLLASKKQSEIYNDVFQTIQTAMNTQDKIWVTLQDMKGQTNGKLLRIYSICSSINSL